MANFKGFKQVSLATYNGYTDEEKKNHLWLVRDLSGETVLSSAIYFGTRKYAEVNDDSAVEAKLDRLIAGLADVVDENGDFVGFTPDHELLSSAETLTELFEILESAVLATVDSLSNKADKDEVESKLAELEEKIDEASAEIESGITKDIEELKGDLENVEGSISTINESLSNLSDVVDQKAEKSDLDAVSDKVDTLEAISSAITEELAEKADKDDVYTKEEIDAKVVGLFHFVGEAESISADETTIVVNGESIVADESNVGAVYQIGDAEYASNGSKWVKLGFNIDLSAYATKEYVNAAIDELDSAVTLTQEALAKEIEEREKLGEQVAEVEKKATSTASTFSDAEEMDLELGQIVYVTSDETVSGITYSSGAYINTQDGLKKLDSTTPSTSTTLEERVESLENRTSSISDLLGDTPFEGNSLTAAVAELQEDVHTTIEGDDVEE